MTPLHDDATACWRTLATVALLGTQRQAPPTPGIGGAIGAALQVVASDDREATLLAQAALLGPYLHSGRLPELAAAPAGPLAPPETRPAPPAHVSAVLEQLLVRGVPALMREWLTLCNQHGYCLPDHLLLACLRWGQKVRGDDESRAALRSCMSERGRWLAAQNPEWSFVRTVQALPDDVEQIAARWEQDDARSRARLLGQVRATRPATSRELILKTWSSDSAEERLLWLETLTPTVSPDDETLLERALDDRSKKVRWMAVQLLARLPDSTTARQIAEQAAGMLGWVPARGGVFGIGGTPAQISVTVPETPGRDLERTLVELTPPRGTSKTSWLLSRMLPLVPPTAWERRWQASPTQIIAAMSGNEWMDDLMAGFGAAAAFHHDTRWAEALFAAHETQQRRLNHAMLIRVLDAPAAEQVALRWLRKGEPHTITHLERPWSVSFSREVLAFLQQLTARPANDTWRMLNVFDIASRRIPPTLLDDARRNWPTDRTTWEQWQSATDGFFATIHTRSEIHREFAR